MHAYIVMPCLNEERELVAACASLGFGPHSATEKSGGTLVLVDNGSSDGTLELMRDIQQASPSGAVELTYELERGYVPPRRRGIDLVSQLTLEEGLNDEDVLILQADADTQYQPGYVAEMRAVCEAAGPQTLLEGRAEAPPEFALEHSAYQALCEQVSMSVRALCCAEADDVIVDDKISAFRLADYRVWGGHVREYDPQGQEIHAETSRLFLRAKSDGARKMIVEGAVARPSRRKLYESPGLYFATNGFPHGAEWVARWRRAYAKIDSFEALHQSHPQVCEAILLRQCHDLILFGVLPLWVGHAAETQSATDEIGVRLAPLLKLLPPLTRDQLRQTPGLVLCKALQLIESQLPQLRCYLAEHAGPA
jgi:glycosyltransferase involved in cell wall biosynthesis